MSDDLVKRLRRDLESGLSASLGDTKEAADRIEKLEAALWEAMNDTPGWYDLARAALKGKTDADA